MRLLTRMSIVTLCALKCSCGAWRPRRSVRRSTSTARVTGPRSGVVGCATTSSSGGRRSSCSSARRRATAAHASRASRSRRSASSPARGRPRPPRRSSSGRWPRSGSRRCAGTSCRRIPGRRARIGARRGPKSRRLDRSSSKSPLGAGFLPSGGSPRRRPERRMSGIQATAEPRNSGPGCYDSPPADASERPPFYRMKTYSAKPGEIARDWYVVDAEGQTLGRLATRIADTLRGKGKAAYTPHVDTGDFVVVVNAEKIQVTGNKLDQKRYYRHSGYPGGLRSRTLREQLDRRPEE